MIDHTSWRRRPGLDVAKKLADWVDCDKPALVRPDAMILRRVGGLPEALPTCTHHRRSGTWPPRSFYHAIVLDRGRGMDNCPACRPT